MDWLTNFFDWSNWLNVITHPLGIAGFALFLVFLVLTKFRKARLSRAVKAAFVSMAFVSLIGGFYLSYAKMKHTGNNVSINVKVGNVTNTPGGKVEIGTVKLGGQASDNNKDKPKSK